MPKGIIYRTELYGEPKEPVPESSRVTLVFGEGIQYLKRVSPTEKFTLDMCRYLLTPESERITRIAAGQILRNVEHQLKVELMGQSLRSPIRDVMRDDTVPLQGKPRLAIGDTVILLGGIGSHGLPPESLSLFAGMLDAVPDFPKFRGVDVNLEGYQRASIYNSLEYARGVIDSKIKGVGSEVESTTLVCPPSRNKMIEAIARRSGIRIDLVRNL